MKNKIYLFVILSALSSQSHAMNDKENSERKAISHKSSTKEYTWGKEARVGSVTVSSTVTSKSTTEESPKPESSQTEESGWCLLL